MNKKLLIDRFLSWPLPESLCSDPCASRPGYPHRTGTNLMTAEHAAAMIEHVIAAPRQPEGEGLEVVAYMVGRYTTDQRESAETFALHHAGGVTELCRLSDHLRAIAELREECNTLRIVAGSVCGERERLRQQLDERDAQIASMRAEVTPFIETHWMPVARQRDKLVGLLREFSADAKSGDHPIESVVEHHVNRIDAALDEVNK